MEQKGTTAPKIERQSITPFFSILIENLRFRSWAAAQTVQPGDLAIAYQFRMNVGVCVVHGEEKRNQRKEPKFFGGFDPGSIPESGPDGAVFGVAEQ
jgi:hypothetical protein